MADHNLTPEQYENVFHELGKLKLSNHENDDTVKSASTDTRHDPWSEPMTFQKTSLALLLALPLAVTAADSPTSPEPAGFIPGIPVLQAAKEAYFAQAKAENPSPAPAAPSSAIEKMRKEDFPEIAPFDIPGQAKKPVVQNECSDFTPAKNALDTMAQLYHHMDYDCLQYASTNNLELLGVPVLTDKMIGGSNYGKIDELVDEYPGKFYITQYINGKSDILYNIKIKISKKFFDAGGNLFDARIFPLDFPPTEERNNIAYIVAVPPESKFNPLDFWGDYAADSLYRWRKENAEIEIISSGAPGGERFTLYFMF